MKQDEAYKGVSQKSLEEVRTTLNEVGLGVALKTTEEIFERVFDVVRLYKESVIERKGPTVYIEYLELLVKGLEHLKSRKVKEIKKTSSDFNMERLFKATGATMQ